MTNINRRGFLVGCSAAIASMAGARLNYAAFGSPEDEPNQEIIIPIFLRGACDVLSVVTPIDGEDRGHYEIARPNLKIPAASLLPLNAQFGLHPSAAPLLDLFTANKLALVLGTGMNSDTRSHFDAMAYMEAGTLGQKTSGAGWLTRFLQSASNIPADLALPTLSAGSIRPASLHGSFDTLTVNSVANFNISNSYWQWRTAQKDALEQLYGTNQTQLHRAGAKAFDRMTLIEEQAIGTYEPPAGVVYENNSFANQLKLIAQMIKLQLGLKVATVDVGGWDTHDGQANNGAPTQGYFADLLGRLSAGLAAFYADLAATPGDYANRVTIVVMSEFGRRVRENAERGTDHGHGSMMMVLGGRVNGGLHGAWPGLHNDQLYDAADLAVTNDYRRILSEIVIRRMGNPNLGAIFPGYQDYSPLGVVQGVDLPPNYAAAHSAYLPLVTR